jgi:hypothetical protein
MNEYEIGETVRSAAEIKNILGQYTDPATLIFTVVDPSGNEAAYTYGVDADVIKSAIGRYYVETVADEAGQWYYSFKSTSPSGYGEGTFNVGVSHAQGIELTDSTDLDYLIPSLRMHLGDTADGNYTYSDNFLSRALIIGFKLVQPRWNFRYLLSYDTATTHWSVTRNPNTTFVQPSPPVIMYADERPIVLAAAVSLRGGLIWTSGSQAVSWKDEEVSFSNISGAKLKEAAFIRDWEELHQLLPERRNRLAATTRQELPGFRNPPNIYEGE